MSAVRIYLNRGGSRTMSDLLNRFGDGKTAFILAGLLVVLLAQPVPVSGAAPDWSYTVGREYISSSDIASDGSAVVIGTTMGQLRLLDGDGVVLWTKSIPGSLMAEISPDNSCIIVASQESLEKDKGAVRGFDRNGTQMWRDVTGWVTDIDLSADARNLVVGTRRGDVIVLDLNGDRLGQYNDFPKTYVVNAAGISGDGTRIAYSLCE
ncbi:MAG: PQQ-binding-like beta-propeller repeat protein, partial [Methanoregulaceae archaeon]